MSEWQEYFKYESKNTERMYQAFKERLIDEVMVESTELPNAANLYDASPNHQEQNSDG